MVKTINREDFKKLMTGDRDIRIVDVLSRESYEKEHIPGAISIPLADLREQAPRQLSKLDTIVVYCASFECQASTKAAELLGELGFEDVFDYKGGLKDYREKYLLQDALGVSTGCNC